MAASAARCFGHAHTHATLCLSVARTPPHAATTRNDAGLAGAELALAVEAHTLATGAVDTVGTTGIFEVLPNAVNSVPRDARLGIGARAHACGPCACSVVRLCRTPQARSLAHAQARAHAHARTQTPGVCPSHTHTHDKQTSATPTAAAATAWWLPSWTLRPPSRQSGRCG
jgi:hypothetical protein